MRGGKDVRIADDSRKGGSAAASAAFAFVASERLREFVLIGVTVVWGGTFLVSQIALENAGPLGILVTRFTLGAVALLVVFWKHMPGMTRQELWGGFLIGVATFAAYALQTYGLVHIPSSRVAFITAMYVPAVPLLQLALLGRAPRLSAWVGIVVAFAGLAILSIGDDFSLAFGSGETLALLGALLAALQIILISRHAPGADAMRLAAVQLGVVALLSMIAMPIVGEPLPRPTPAFLLSGAALGLLGTAFAIGAMNWAQQSVSATRATIIYAMEPVWAGVFGAAVGEVLTRSTVIGSGLIVLAVLISELRWARPRLRSRRQE